MDFGREEHEEKTIFLPPPLPYLSRFWPTHLVAIIPFPNLSPAASDIRGGGLTSSEGPTQ